MRTPHTELLGQLPLGRQPLPGMQTARVKLLLDVLQDGVDLIVVRRLHFIFTSNGNAKFVKKTSPTKIFRIVLQFSFFRKEPRNMHIF